MVGDIIYNKLLANLQDLNFLIGKFIHFIKSYTFFY